MPLCGSASARGKGGGGIGKEREKSGGMIGGEVEGEKGIGRREGGWRRDRRGCRGREGIGSREGGIGGMVGRRKGGKED